MRPPDENQNGSTRPNFMSASRRAAGGDDNILARLERDAKRKPAAATNHARLAWCGLAAVAIIGLIGILASLAKENLSGHQQPTLIEAKAAPDLFANGGFAPQPRPDTSTTASTVLADLPIAAPKTKSSDHDGVPPMVMLKPAAAPVKPSATVKTAAPVKTALPVKMAAVSKTAAQPSTKTLTPSSAARNATSRLAAKSTPAKPVTAPARPIAAAAARSTNAPSRPVIATAPARKKTASAAAPAKPEPAAVDSDVALLSAIIMHASRHADERAQIEAAQCGAGKKCPQSAAAAALKATD